MSLKEIGEFGFIKKISRGCLIRPDNIIKAIGDDAAAFMTEPEQLALITTDLLVERIHFLRETISGFDLGYKSLAVNLSDIAAMGGTAREAFVSIAIPDDYQLDYLEAIYHISSEKQAARAKDISDRLEVNKSSVTGALRALSEKGLVNYAPYDLITLTYEGEQVAKEVVRRHETLKDFFIKILLLEEDEAEEAACKIEATFSINVALLT